MPGASSLGPRLRGDDEQGGVPHVNFRNEVLAGNRFLADDCHIYHPKSAKSHRPRMRRLIGEALALRIEPTFERFMWHFYRERQS
jgi:hypothetical protein